MQISGGAVTAAAAALRLNDRAANGACVVFLHPFQDTNVTKPMRARQLGCGQPLLHFTTTDGALGPEEGVVHHLVFKTLKSPPSGLRAAYIEFGNQPPKKKKRVNFDVRGPH